MFRSRSRESFSLSSGAGGGGHCRLVEQEGAVLESLELASGDHLAVGPGPERTVLLSVDDVEDSFVPTAALSPAECRWLAFRLLSRAAAIERIAAIDRLRRD